MRRDRPAGSGDGTVAADEITHRVPQSTGFTCPVGREGCEYEALQRGGHGERGLVRADVRGQEAGEAQFEKSLDRPEFGVVTGREDHLENGDGVDPTLGDETSREVAADVRKGVGLLGGAGDEPQELKADARAGVLERRLAEVIGRGVVVGDRSERHGCGGGDRSVGERAQALLADDAHRRVEQQFPPGLAAREASVGHLLHYRSLWLSVQMYR